MRMSRRAAVLAVGMALGVSAIASPGWAEPAKSTQDRSVLTAPLENPKPGEAVPADADGRVLLYVDGQQESALRDAVRGVGGEVSSAQGGRVQAAIPPDKLDEFAAAPAVSSMRRQERAIPMAITSEGVAASGTDGWIADGKRGAGVKIGIIDVGFEALSDAQAAGELPPTGTALAVNNDNCHDATKFEDHGTAVAEVVHDMAPDAQLFLACIDGPMDFAPATDWLRAQGVGVITAAVGFLTSGRGDGTGEAGSPADAVKRAREAGVFWAVAAGNLARNHFAGKASDANGDGYVEFSGTAQNNGFNLASGQRATVGLRWDAWPKTTEDLDLYVMKTNRKPTGPDDPEIRVKSTINQRDVQGGGKPTEEVTFTNTEGAALQYWIYVKNNNAQFTRQFDLFVSGASSENNSSLQFSTPAGSVTEPATSAYAMAVGATRHGSGRVESFSGQGPTIDGRVKPDITGFDAVSTSTYGAEALVGTSAGAAHVAGAAAVLKSANQQLDAAQLESALRAKATNPKTPANLWGSGVLAMGTPDTVPVVTGAGYTPLTTPKALQDRQYPPNDVFTLPIPGVPGDTKAVVFNLAVRTDPGAGPDVNTGIDVFPGDPAQSTSRARTISVTPASGYVSTMVVAAVGADRAIRLRNGPGHSRVQVDLLGYFSTNGGSTYFAEPAPVRVLDTRGFSGSPRATPLGNQEVHLMKARGVAGVPQNATAIAVNITGVESSVGTALGAYGSDAAGTTLNLLRNDRRSNMSIVAIGDDGNIRLRNGAGLVHVLVDVVGWFAPGNTGGRFVALPESARIADTTTGTGGRTTRLGQGETEAYQVGGIEGVSSTATAAVLRASATEDSLGTELSLAPAESGWSPVTAIASRQREPASGTTLTPLGTGGKVSVRNERGQASVAVDVAGYFVGGVKGPVTAGGCAAPTGEAGFTPMFDGRAESDFGGWLTAGATPVGVEGCELATKTGNVDVSWYAARTYGNDYTVKLDWKATSDNADSGVFVLFPNPGADPAVPGNRGLEVQIGPKNAGGTYRSGGIAGFRGPDVNAAKPTGEWNTYEITVSWNTVTVLLNGQKVNEFTTTDPARINANSFIGLQNNGASDQVRYRNIRAKRNTPVRSGQFVGLNGKCLELLDANPDNTRVQLNTCNDGTAQVWTMAGDGQLMNAGKCLTVHFGGTANGTETLLWTCGPASGGQEWLLRSDGSLVNPPSGRCLTPNSADNGSRLTIRDCTGGADQVWRTPDQRGRSGALVNPAGKCLDVYNNDPRVNVVQVWDCWGNIAQRWTAPGDGSLRADGKCLITHLGGTDVGTRILIWDCGAVVGSAGQWVLKPDGTVVNPQSGRCLTAASTNRGAGFTLQNCSTDPLQQWRMSAQELWAGPVVGLGTKCADIKGEDPANRTVWLWTCYGPPGEQWRAPGDGSIQSMTACLDIGALGNGTGTVVVGCHNGESQQWAARPNGQLVNVQAGRCFDVTGAATADGTSLQIYDCHPGANQRWALPLRAS